MYWTYVDAADPPDVTATRKKEEEILWGWVEEYVNGDAAY